MTGVRGSYTADWFTAHAQIWPLCVGPLLGYGPVRWLEIGSYEGLSAIWTLDNLLPPGSTITCVDHFDRDYEQRFDANVRGEPRILKVKGKARDVLPRMEPGFGGAYVDGAHEEEEVAHDARAVWRLLKPGAPIVFDDCGLPGPGAAVAAFLVEVGSEARVLSRGYQIFAVKL